MSNYLNVPSELQHMIEKRIRDDRRFAERRGEDISESDDVPDAERRESERRAEALRRESDG